MQFDCFLVETHDFMTTPSSIPLAHENMTLASWYQQTFKQVYVT
jgi:hypothetical protein